MEMHNVLGFYASKTDNSFFRFHLKSAYDKLDKWLKILGVELKNYGLSLDIKPSQDQIVRAVGLNPFKVINELCKSLDELVNNPSEALLGKPPLFSKVLTVYADAAEVAVEAIEDYKKSLGLDPTSGATLDDIAQCYFLLGDFRNAHAYIDQAIQIEESSDIPMIRKAQFFEYEKRTPEAIEQYKKTLNKFPDSEYAKNKILELSKY